MAEQPAAAASSASSTTLAPSKGGKETYVQQFEKLIHKFKTETEEFQTEKEKWEQEKATLRKGQVKIEDEIVTLNVGGKLFTTTVSTLSSPLLPPPPKPKDEDSDEESDEEEAAIKSAAGASASAILLGSSGAGASSSAQPGDEIYEEHFFSAIISDRFDVVKDQKGNVFIDRDPQYFRYILNYLRCGGDFYKCEFPWEQEHIIEELKHEAEFYNLKTLAKILKKGELNLPELPSGVPVLSSSLKSSIVKKSEQKKWLLSKLPKGAAIKPLYKGSKDGFTAVSFHAKCDNKGPTLVLIETTGGSILGGYGAQAWNSTNQYINASGSFLFGLQYANNTQLRQYNCTQVTYAMYGASGYMAYFGGDLYICSNCNTTSASYASVGSYYQSVDGTYPQIVESSPFRVKEFEVFTVKDRKSKK